MAKVLTFKVGIEGLEDKIWRCIEITDRRTVADLAYTILATFDSLAYHLYDIKHGNDRYDCMIEPLELEDCNFKDAVRTKLSDVDFENKTISVKIGKNELAQVTIEADLPNIINRSIVLHSNSNDTNKLIVYDMTNVSTSKTYYLHSDDTYDTNNTDRIVPVVLEIAGVVPTESDNFDSMADAYASNLFNSISYNNLIELEMINNDELVKPQNMSIGQTLNIVSGGQSYSTILTGRRIGSTTTLVCGTVRLDLTKILLNN